MNITFFFGYTVEKYRQKFQKFRLGYVDLYPKPEQDTNNWELDKLEQKLRTHSENLI